MKGRKNKLSQFLYNSVEVKFTRSTNNIWFKRFLVETINKDGQWRWTTALIDLARYVTYTNGMGRPNILASKCNYSWFLIPTLK